MKAVAGYLLGALLFAIVALAFLRIGVLDGEIAEAQTRAINADYPPLERALEAAEPFYEYANRLPWVGPAPLNELRAERAALDYWQRRYAALVPAQDDPLAGVPADNVDLQFLVASGVFRQGLSRAKDRDSTVEALDAGIGAYQTVLKNAVRHEDAAYNYEYLVRLRTEVDKGRKKVPPNEPASPLGASGAPQEIEDTKQHKLYVPLDSEERQKNTEGEAGRAKPLKRKG
jgi:hypothetical protein